MYGGGEGKEGFTQHGLGFTVIPQLVSVLVSCSSCNDSTASLPFFQAFLEFFSPEMNLIVILKDKNVTFFFPSTVFSLQAEV